MHLALLLLAAIALAIAGCGAAERPPQPGAASATPVASAVATIQVENQREGGDSAKTIDYVAPELFPDLAPLKAASDLVIRGISEGADRFAITEVLVNRLQVDPSTVRLRLIQQPPDDPPLHSDPPLVAGLKYVLFFRAFWNPIPDFFRASHTFRPIGGPQGQWLIRDGAVIQQAEVPLKKALDGETLDRFVSALNGTPDLRAVAAALLQKHGWGPSEPEARMDDVASAAVLERDAEYRARLEASRGIGLDFVPYQGRQVLRLIYRLDSRGLDGWALVADGKAIGAWLRIPGRGLIFRLDRHEEALAAVADPRVRPSPTLDPNPIGDRPNLVQHFRLGEATDMWLKGAIRGGLTRDDAVRIRILAALDTEVAVERVGRDLVPPDDANTILVVFDTKDGLVPLRYHVDQHRVYIQERGVLFAPPPAFVAALEPFYQPIQVPGTLSKSIRPTESPAASASLPAAR